MAISAWKAFRKKCLVYVGSVPTNGRNDYCIGIEPPKYGYKIFELPFTVEEVDAAFK